MTISTITRTKLTNKFPGWLYGICFLLAALYVGGLFWGSHSLGMAAVRSLYDFKLFMKRPPIWVSDQSTMFAAQREYLRQSIPETSQPVYPRIQVNVQWDVLVASRVKTYGASDTNGFEINDAIYLNIFGFWIELYSIRHSIACG